MSSSDEKVLSLPCLGRPFRLGMLYDCRTDSIVPGMTLWDSQDLKKTEESMQSYQPSSSFELIAEDSLADKTFHLNVEASLALSFMSGMVSVSGSAKFLTDRKESKKTSRVTLQFKCTSHFKELSMEQLGKLKYSNKVFKRDVATHVVTGVVYGADAFFVFDREIEEKENYQDVHGEMKIAIKSIPNIQISGEGSLDITSKEEEKSDKFHCKFYGDILLPENPTTFKGAVKVYQDLPALIGITKGRQSISSGRPLETAGQDHAQLMKNLKTIPKTVWLYPLAKLSSKADCIVRDISTRLVGDSAKLLESLHDIRMRSNDLMKSKVFYNFQGMKHQLMQFKDLIAHYETYIMQQLSIILPEIRGGGMEEQKLAELFQNNYDSPFSYFHLVSYLDRKEREIKVLEKCLEFMGKAENDKKQTCDDKDNEVTEKEKKPIDDDTIEAAKEEKSSIEFAFQTGEMDSVIYSFDHEYVLSFEFANIEKNDPFLDSMQMYLKAAKNSVPSELEIVRKRMTGEVRHVVKADADPLAVMKDDDTVTMPTERSIHERGDGDKISESLQSDITTSIVDEDFEDSIEDTGEKKEEIEKKSALERNVAMSMKRALTAAKRIDMKDAVKKIRFFPGSSKTDEDTHSIRSEDTESLASSYEVADSIMEKDYIQDIVFGSTPQIARKFVNFVKKGKIQRRERTKDEIAVDRSLPEVLPLPIEPQEDQQRDVAVEQKDEIKIVKSAAIPLERPLPPARKKRKAKRASDHTADKETSLQKRNVLQKNRVKKDEDMGWYEDPDLIADMRDKVVQFKHFVRANVDSEKTCFALTDGSLKVKEAEKMKKGAMIHLYRGGMPVEYTPPSRPGKPTGKAQSSTSISLEWPKPDHGEENIVRYIVFYCSVTSHSDVPPAEEWESDKTETNSLVVTNLERSTQYVFQVQAVCAVGNSEKSKVSDIIETKTIDHLEEMVTRSTLISAGNPETYLYSPDSEKCNLDEKYKIAKCEIGNVGKSSKPMKTILVTSLSPSLRQSVISMFFNHVFGITWNENIRFQLSISELSEKIDPESEAEWLKIFDIAPQGEIIPFTLRIVELPIAGLKNETNYMQLIEAFTNFGIDSVSCVVLVSNFCTKPLSKADHTDLAYMLSIFSSNFSNNLCLVYNGGYPSSVLQMNKFEIPYNTFMNPSSAEQEQKTASSEAFTEKIENFFEFLSSEFCAEIGTNETLEIFDSELVIQNAVIEIYKTKPKESSLDVYNALACRVYDALELIKLHRLVGNPSHSPDELETFIDETESQQSEFLQLKKILALLIQSAYDDSLYL